MNSGCQTRTGSDCLFGVSIYGPSARQSAVHDRNFSEPWKTRQMEARNSYENETLTWSTQRPDATL